MAFYGQHQMSQMQEEMDRFEKEIAGQLARPPRPRMAGPNMSLRFIPHQLHAARPVSYAPPVPSAQFVHQGISTAAVAATALANSGPRFQPIPAAGQRSQTASAVIEGAPTKYSTTTPVPSGKGAQAMAQTSAGGSMVNQSSSSISSTAAFTPKSASINNSHTKSNEAKESKASSSSSNSTLAYTVVGGTGLSKPSTSGTQAPKKPKRYVRVGGGQVWSDPSLNEWDPSDFRLFCGDLGNEVSDELLAKAFRKYPSFQKAKVVREKRTNKTKGYGFISFKDPEDFARAMREMDGKYVGNRPIKLRKSTWRDRNMEVVKKKKKVKAKLGLKL